MISAVILAAGEGRRLGGVAKALLPIGETDYLQTIRAACAEAVVVIAAPHAAAIRAAHPDATYVDNPDAARGMATSIARGFAYLLAHSAASAAWLWPVDHPFVQPGTLAQLVAALGEHAVARPRYRERGGHPPLIARRAWAALAECAEVGARQVIAALDVVDVVVDDAGVVRDVDTPEDLA